MPRKNKKFIDKKNAVSFQLVHRSQKDPLIASETNASVLAPLDEKFADPETRKLEQTKFGIYFDDDYNYLQHLRDANELSSLSEHLEDRYRIYTDNSVVGAGEDIAPSTSKVVLPSSVFASKAELEVGLLNQAAPNPGPHPDWDPDVVAALDDDFDFDNPDNTLEDNFIEKANADGPVDAAGTSKSRSTAGSEDADDYSDYADDGGSGSECGGFDPEGYGFAGEETRSRFTEYSMTSSVIRRSQGLKKLDDVFEKFYSQYDDDACGDLDLDAEEISGGIKADSERMLRMIKDHEEARAKIRNRLDPIAESEDNKSATLNQEDEELDAQGIDRQLEQMYVGGPKRLRQQWDCESVVSLYSNQSNHPTMIREERKKKISLDKAGLPKGVLSKGLTAAGLATLDDDTSEGASRGPPTQRPKHKVETPEERRARKMMVREERRERRIEKKANRLAFKDEDKRISAQDLNAQKIKGMKLL